MKLFIAEKPSLGRAIAAALPKPHKKGEGFITVGNGDCVSWCIGHLLEQAEPAAYDARYKQWRLEHLPIVPEQWQLKPRAASRKQLSVLRKLVKQADSLVHAGDPDREGQLLVDEVVDFLKVPGPKRESMQRCLISDLTLPAVKASLAALKPNRDFVPLSVSALARSRADWLYGINMTRAYTLAGRKVGFDGLLSVGRVQTPLLGLVVARDREIANFSSRSFYQLQAHIETGQGGSFIALWQPSEACQRWQDEQGRVLSRPLLENVQARIVGKPATLKSQSSKLKKLPPPLPYSLSALQIDAGKRFGLSAKQVLDGCQALYERHQLLTYPRSDCRYLPEQHFAESPAVRRAIAGNCVALQEAVAGADESLKGRAWSDARVSAHHAIVPTAKRADLSTLTKVERQLYEQVARQYLAQFYPPQQCRDALIELLIEGGLFVAKARQVEHEGWKQLFPRSSKSGADADEDQSRVLNHQLPRLNEGSVLHCSGADIIDKQTSPPKPFDDASLLAAMTGIARYVGDPQLRKVLKDSDGLGTEATRAGIIELLFKRSFLQRQGKQIRATETGCGLIDSLPLAATSPDMTARWETQLDSICAREIGYGEFMRPLSETLTALVGESARHLPLALKGVKSGASKKRFQKRAAAGAKKKSIKRPAEGRA